VAGAGDREFPRTQRFLLRDRIQTTALDILECLIEATYTRDRRFQLTRANLGIEKLRFFFRLAVELHYLDRRRYQHAACRRDRAADRRMGQGACRGSCGHQAAARTPANIIGKLNAAVGVALADSGVRARLADLGQEIFPRDQQTPEALAAFQKAEIEKWWPIIKAAGIKIE
jgi:hypothetical protein